jgi:hypothetical protein
MTPAENMDGNIGVGSLTSLVPGATSFDASVEKESRHMSMQSLQASLPAPLLQQYQKAPLDYGAVQSGSFNEPQMRQPVEHPNTFGYGHQIQQNLSGHMSSPHQPIRQSVSGSVADSPGFLSRQNSAPMPIRSNGFSMNPEPFDRNFLRDSRHQDRQPAPPAPANFQYDSILPLNDRRPTAQHHFEDLSHKPGMATNIFSRDQPQPKSDQDIVNNIFGQPVQAPPFNETANDLQREGNDSLLQTFGNLSFGGGGGGNELGLEGANWDWEGLMNDDSNNRVHRVGLGGVRLDTSTEMPNTSDVSSNQFKSNWNK